MRPFWKLTGVLITGALGVYALWIAVTVFWVEPTPAVSYEVVPERVHWNKVFRAERSRADFTLNRYRYAYAAGGRTYTGNTVSTLLVYDLRITRSADSAIVWYVVPLPFIAMLVKPDPWYVAGNLAPFAVCLGFWFWPRRAGGGRAS